MPFQHPCWSYDSNIYEVNVRQYTPEGTFRAFATHLPRLKDMGVEILWFMPITPISLQDRKGTLGSYYAVQDYTAVNPEFGNLRDFIDLVSDAHTLGFKIIIDWVANHTGNDHLWLQHHPDFFSYEEGRVVHPHGWEDVSKLNFDNPHMQAAMVDAMRFWIDTCAIDGFRCDMAHLVPLDFWKKARTELGDQNPGLFWLAECEEANYHLVFDATYTWKWMHATEQFCKGQMDFNHLAGILEEYRRTFSGDAFRVYFTSNHDENSWNGTEYEKFGEAAKALAVFSCTWNGLPMIYSGQELPNHKRLHFFEKDDVEWETEIQLHDFYKSLLQLRKINPSLRAGDTNVVTRQHPTPAGVFSFTRSMEGAAVWVVINLSQQKTGFEILDNTLRGMYKDVFNNASFEMTTPGHIELQPWEYKVYEKEKAR